MDVLESECFQLPLKQLVGLASDGASVLISPRNGVMPLLRERVSCSHSTVAHIVWFWLPKQGSTIFHMRWNRLSKIPLVFS